MSCRRCGCVYGHADGCEPAMLIGCRAGDPYWQALPGSVGKPCYECRIATMFSPATLARPEAKLARFVCVQCAVGGGLLKGMRIEPPNQAQRAEREAVGLDPEAWALREFWGKVIP